MLNFTISDWLQLFGIIASLITSIVAICISIKTLQQNNKMIEESTRPIIHVYSKYVDGILYIIIKNLGQSVAFIDDVETDFYISENNNMVEGNPFTKLINGTITPNNSRICPLVSPSLKNRKFNFKISYHSTTNNYVENFFVDSDAENPFPDNHSTINNKNNSDDVTALKVIAHTLQDILKTKL